MQNKAQTQKLTLFTPLQVAITTFVFGPLAGGLMSGMDYRKFKKRTWLLVLLAPTVIQIVAVFTFIVLFPKSELPPLLFPLFSAITYFLYQYKLYQFLPFEKAPESFLKTLLYGFLGANLLFLPVLLLIGTEEAVQLVGSLT